MSEGKLSSIAVSVIVPTHHRPELVVTAVASALNQDFENFEVIVVIDGEDTLTEEALRELRDARLRVIPLAANVGGAEARNVGVREARGKWVAFLDDDDQWLPQKLTRQIIAARWNRAAWPVISSKLVVRTPGYESVRPLRSYEPEKPISEFLFCRRSLKDGPFAMQTSTLMMRRELMMAVPFQTGLKRHQDWDWLLRAERVPGVAFAVIREPLVIYRAEDERESVGRGQDAEFSMDWGAEMRSCFSRKAYAWFLATECATRAVKSKAGVKVYAEILRRFVLEGRPSPGSMVMMAAFLGVPTQWLARAQNLMRTRRRRVNAPSRLWENEIQTTAIRMEQ